MTSPYEFTLTSPFTSSIDITQLTKYWIKKLKKIKSNKNHDFNLCMTLPFVFTLGLFPVTSPYNFTQGLHYMTSTYYFNTWLYPITSPWLHPDFTLTSPRLYPEFILNLSWLQEGFYKFPDIFLTSTWLHLNFTLTSTRLHPDFTMTSP